jgi:dihydrofolate synthase/folylpolyglutamate synthase
MSYAAAVDHLYALGHELAPTPDSAPRRKFDLAHMRVLASALGEPQAEFPAVLIAGTNGKGSTAATLASILTAAGYRTGLYTSPHLSRVNERVQIDSVEISDEDFARLYFQVDEAARRLVEAGDLPHPPSFFEVLTALAFLYFAERQVEVAVLEVGLGGRLDATNVAPASASVVTSIGLDHVQELGPTVAAIAGEKAGVFRAGRPALVDGRLPDALASFHAAASRTGARLHDMAEESTVSGIDVALSGTAFRLRTPVRDYALETPLRGAHQAANAAMAVRAAELLGELLPAGEAEIVRGVAAVRWPGRLERFAVRGKSVFLDGCHNPDGASALGLFIVETGLDADLVFGAMGDKDVASMAGVLAPMVHRIRLVPAASDRAASPDELAARFAPFRDDAEPSPSLVAALDELLSDPASESIIVAGSLYLVGEARSLLLSGRFGS